MRSLFLGLAVSSLTGCYGLPEYTRDMNRAWVGHTHEEIVGEFGKPAQEQPLDGGLALTWSRTNRHYTLPSGYFRLKTGPGMVDLDAALMPGETWTTTTTVHAGIDGTGRIIGVTGPSLRWGQLDGLNMRHGFIFGLAATMGVHDDAGKPLPGVSIYTGGMLGPRLGLVGSFAMVNSRGDAPDADISLVWSLGAQWWATPRLSLRGGPAIALGLDGDEDGPAGHLGANGVFSFAAVRTGTFVLDVRAETTLTPDSQFATLGVGVNVN